MTRKQTRRDFLRKTSAGTAALAVGAVGTQAFAIRRPGGNPLETIRIGVVGTGGRGGGACSDNLHGNDNVKIVAMADLVPSKCKRLRDGLAKKRGPEKVDVSDDRIYSGLDGYEKIIGAKDIDVVFLTTPPGFRPPYLEAAVAAKKHVFAEKPVCVDPAGYRACLRAHEQAEKQGTAIVTGTQYRRQTSFLKAIELIHGGKIGKPIAATARYCSSGIWYRGRKDGMSGTRYQIHNWMHFVWLSGDQITEQAVHNIDAMNWVFGGPPESAYGSGGRFTRPADSEMWDSASIDYTYPGNRLLSFACRQIPGTASDVHNVVYCQGGIAYINAMNGGSRIVDEQGKEILKVKGDIRAAYWQEHKDLIASIRAGKPIVELKETANSSLTAVMGRMAAYTGRKVSWDFAANESKLDLFPKSLSLDADMTSHGHAVPGRSKLV
ncbi:MAG: dehydrogenase [Planctomycetes bacterium]|nr:dehydrogenase [Planctomycetota bacterium]